MKPATSLAVCLAAMMPLASAWPSWLPDVDALVVRQDSDETSASQTESGSRPRQTDDDEDEDDDDDGDNDDEATTTASDDGDLNTASASSGSASDSASGSASGSSSGSSRSGSSTGTRTQTEFEPDDPVGSIVMLTPAPTDPSLRLYKIGENVTFGWNYTNVQATPTAIDVLVSCSAATASWTLTQNMTFSSKGSFIWDTNEQATAVQSPLLTEEYTLIIYDAESDISATPEPGYLGVYDQFTFDMYTPRPYKDLDDYQCPTCSSGVPGFDHKAAGVALTMSILTVASFTWFVTGVLF